MGDVTSFLSPTNLFSGLIGQDNKTLGTSSSGSASTTTGTSTDTTATHIDNQGLQYLLNEMLGSTSGLAATVEGQHTAGVYDSSTNQLLTSDLLTRDAGIVAANNKTATETKTGTSETDNTGTATESPAQGIGQITIICTYFTSIGAIPLELYKRSGVVAKKKLRMVDLRGYHYWSIPVVRRIKQGGIFAEILKAIFLPIAIAWVNNLVGNRSVLGYFTWYVMKPICTILGATVARAPQPWESLYFSDSERVAQLELGV